MPSPFPGMDPYLEGYLWPDVHQALASKLRQLLTPLVRPRYIVRLGVAVVEDTTPEVEVGIMYPAVEVLLTQRHGPPVVGEAPDSTASARRSAPVTIPIIAPVDVRLVTVEVRDTGTNRLITSIEIISPVNKREPGVTHYRQKRQRLRQAGVHLIEIDLIRRGTRAIEHPRIPAEAAYLIALTRAHAPAMDVWPLRLSEPLPVVPVPLHAPDEDVDLDLPAAFSAVYDEAAYDLSIDERTEPPPPPLSEADARWLLTMRPAD
jgi:hypothetical protein